MTGNDGSIPIPATAERRLFLFSLWYFPSHFGLHVDDVASAFSAAGYDVTVVTIAKAAFALPYFDAFREVFDVAVSEWPRLVRLNVEHLEERGVYNPRLTIGRDSTFHDLRRQMESGPCHLLHFFEMFVPYFNSETVPASVATAVLYAGNFITRIIGQQPGAEAARISPERVAETQLRPYSVSSADGGYRLRGVDCIFSETRELARMLGATGLQTPCWWTSRPIFTAPVLAAAPHDIRTEWSISSAAKVLLYAGRPAKNARALVSILKLVRLRYTSAPVVLVLVGVRAEDFGDWPGACDIREWVRTAPFVSRAKLFGMMKSADIFIYPGLIDGHPKVISEANLARLPTVAFNSPASGLREIVTHGDSALLVDVASGAATDEAENERFAAAVIRILTESALRNALVERAFLAAREMDGRDFVKKLERLWRRGQSCKAGPGAR